MTDDEIQVVVNSHCAWGKAANEQDALCNMAGHWNSTYQDSEVIHLIRYRGTLEKLSMFGHVEVDGEIVETEALEIDGDRLERLSELVASADGLADEILAEAEEVEDED